MKSLYLTFDDKEFKRLEEAKAKLNYKSWRKMLMELVKNAMQK